MNISRGEKITRTIRYNRHIRSSDNRAKPDAFLPKDCQNDMSVFRISAFDNYKELLGQEVWGFLRSQCLKFVARTDLLVSDVYDCGLKVIPDNSPPRHASISSLPDFGGSKNPTIRKQRRDFAVCLATKSSEVYFEI